MDKFFSKHIPSNENAYILGFRAENGDTQEARISLKYGANLCRYAYNGFKIIDYQPKLLAESDFTGTPVLYPSPNRVENGIICYGGKSYDQVKRGRRILEHGLVYDEQWDLVDFGSNTDHSFITARIDWVSGNDLFEAFPFPHTITMTYELLANQIVISYQILNKGHNQIPYGLGLHPYFCKLSGDDRTTISVPVSHVMEATEELLPTGKILPVENTAFDLSLEKPIGDYDLDHVFMRGSDVMPAVIRYLDQKFEIHITSTTDFSYFVVYTPKGEPFFCIEEQTCSTNAHNLYSKGFHDLSGLKFILPGETKSGTVRYSIHPLSI